jgi:hypothetical protein
MAAAPDERPGFLPRRAQCADFYVCQRCKPWDDPFGEWHQVDARPTRHQKNEFPGSNWLMIARLSKL